jgi:hypothetical protein
MTCGTARLMTMMEVGAEGDLPVRAQIAIGA